MSNWKSSRRKNIIIESTGIVLMAVCIIIGIIFDIEVSNGYVRHEVNNIDSFSLTLLQIQAAISTLTIALVALISGNISDSYMGVGISDYVLNIRPVILKQKIIIILSIIFIVVNVFFNLLEFYNLVIFIFVATCILILISIYEIYGIFKGIKTLENEIESYVCSKQNYMKMTLLINNFVSDWTENLEKQNKATYDKYLNLFKDGMDYFLSIKTDDSMKQLERVCYDIAYTLLNSEKTNIKLRGITFISEIYERIWVYILANKEKEFPYKVSFELFNDIQQDYWEAISILPIDDVGKNMRWNDLYDDIERTIFWIGYTTEENACAKMETPNSFARYFGYNLLKEQKKNNIYNKDYWGQVIKNMFLSSACNIPVERQNSFLWNKCIMYFNYCYGLIVNGSGDIIVDNLYISFMGNEYFLKSKYEALLCIMVHSYVFYLAEREGLECITEEIKQSAKSIIDNSKVKSTFTYFLRCLSDEEDFFDNKTRKIICKSIERFECMPRYSNAKTTIMEYAVSDLYFFIVAYIANKFYMEDLLKKIVDSDEAIYYQLHYMGEHEETSKNLLFNLYELVIETENEESNIRSEVNMMYDRFENVVYKEIKNDLIDKTAEKQKEYEENFEEKSFSSIIKNDVNEHIKKVFAPIIVNQDTSNGIIKLHLLSCSFLTETLKEETIAEFYSDIDGAFVKGIQSILQKRNKINVVNRYEFHNDEEYMAYLKETDIYILMGSEYAIKNMDYKVSPIFKEYLNDCVYVYTGFTREAIAIKKDSLKVFIHDINVSIHALSLGEINVDSDTKSHEYVYEVQQGMKIGFNKDELKSFIHNQRKILDISAKISISTEDNIIGSVLKRER